jgi:hypothetical protein
VPNELNGPYGAAEGYNGVTQGSVGALKGGDVKPGATSNFSPSGGMGSVLDAGTLMALKAILPAFSAGKKTQTPSEGAPTQGSQAKQTGQGQPASPAPASPGGPGVTAVGNNANLAQIIKVLFGGR